MFSIFAVFLRIENQKRINTKIALYLKFPYACKSNGAFKQNISVRISGIYDTMLPFKEAECEGLIYKTYSKTKNNTIYYYNHIFSNSAISINYPDTHYLFWFMIDIAKDIYRPIDFSKINYITGKDKSLLFMLKNKFYVISSRIHKKNLVNLRHPHDYVAIIEVNSKKELYLEDRKNNLYLDFLYPIANRIVPVLQVNKSGMHVHFVDLINGQINTVSWTLDKIWQIIIDIVGKDENFKHYRKKVSRDTFKEIDSVKSKQEWYLYNSNEENVKYVESIKKHFEITIKARKIEFQLTGLRLDIVFDQNSLKCYLNLNIAVLKINNSVGVFYRDYYEEDMILLKEIPISSEIPDIHLSNIVYKDKCYAVFYRPEIGIAINRNELDVVRHYTPVFTKFATYRYENYLFIFRIPYDRYKVCLAIIDLKQNIIYPFVSKDVLEYILRNIYNNNLEYIPYYFKKSDELIFLATNSSYIFTIKLRELANRLQSIKTDKCDKEYYEYAEDFIEILVLERLISDAIYKECKIQIENSAVDVLSYHIDKNLDKLYITAQYNIEDILYLGLFEFMAFEKGIFLKLISYSPLRYLLYHRNKGHINLANLKVQAIYDNRTINRSLEMACNTKTMFIDIRSNRISTRILSKDVNVQNGVSEIFGHLLYVKLRIGYSWFDEWFVLSGLNLVNKMTALKL
jgi:hypothetical protein